jgi:hypothetical protein
VIDILTAGTAETAGTLEKWKEAVRKRQSPFKLPRPSEAVSKLRRGRFNFGSTLICGAGCLNCHDPLGRGRRSIVGIGLQAQLYENTSSWNLALLIDVVHESGLQIHVWTVNDPRIMQRLVKLGVDGIVTDRPDLAVGAIKD